MSRSRGKRGTATGGSAPGRACTDSRPPITFPQSKRRGRSLCTRRKTDWPLGRSFACSKTRAATCGSQPRQTASASRDGNRPARALHDLSHSPGLPSVKDDWPRSFGEDPAGNVWIGFNHGLARYAHGRFRLFTASEGLPPGTIMNIHVDRSSRLWLASDGIGLVRVDDAGAERPAFVSYTTSQGLSSNNTEVITEDDLRAYLRGRRAWPRPPRSGDSSRQAFHGCRWPAARSVPGRVPRSAWRPVVRHEQRPGAARPGGRDAASAATGVDQRGARLGRPAVRLGIGGTRNCRSPIWRPAGTSCKSISSPWVSRRVKCCGINTGSTAPTPIGARSASSERSPTPGLGPGRYRFTVRAVNSDGIASDHPAVITFTVLRPVWLRWWFLTLSVIAVGLTVRTAVSLSCRTAARDGEHAHADRHRSA